VLDRAKLGCDDLSLPLREMEESREDFAEVVRGEDPGELDDAGRAEAPFPEGLHHGRVVPDHAGRGHPVERGSLGEPEVPVEVVEERGVAELAPATLGIERRERDEKLSHRIVLATEEIGEAGGFFAGGGRHEGDPLKRFPDLRKRTGAAQDERIRDRLAAPMDTPRTRERRRSARQGHVREPAATCELNRP
jgi:hypothetical protein